MLCLVNRTVMTLLISIVLLSIYTIIIVHGDEDDGNWIDNVVTDSSLRFGSDTISEVFAEHLDDFYEGDTFALQDLSDIITHRRIEDNICQLRFGPQITGYFGDRLLIGELTQLKTVVSVQIIFYDDSDSILLDDFGDSIQYSSSPHVLGHLFDKLHPGLVFSYAKCLLRLQPDSNFDLNNLFFHFEHASSIVSEINTTGIIIGATSFSVDSMVQIYNASVECPLNSRCMWLLDNKVISKGSETYVTLIVNQSYIGNRTLSYVAFSGKIRQTLASILLSILPSITRGQIFNTIYVFVQFGIMSHMSEGLFLFLKERVIS